MIYTFMVLRIVLRFDLRFVFGFVLWFVLNFGSKILFKLVDESRKIDKMELKVVKENMNDDYIRNSYRGLS